ncbi:PcfJ domain-containing protein [Flavobacterium aquiphilum]|uniref:PcfJ domain-containing protein n=1 Tax=Flavobacterium aquiphilum TaxID=3003261 RepID=UPI002480344E|nr:PcfJ domain-containing protein [Flavobacterium aquiphilum]
MLKRNGFKTGFYNIAPQILFASLLKDPHSETMLKASQTSLLSYYLTSHAQHINENWQAVKTCLKNNYKIEDFKTWEDYISLLRWFKKDLSCSGFVCPDNLNAAHDRLVSKKRAVQRKKYLLQIRSEIQKAQVLYAQEKEPFFGLRFSQDNLSLYILENVKDFMEEGDLLSHCIFTNEYYTKTDSLLFSAQLDNRPIETLELSLSKMKVIQCRGFKNKPSKYHKSILNLMEQNLYQIRSRLKQQNPENL